jgi:hypothetical protein
VDLAVSKLLAGRPKDIDFVRAMLRYGLIAESHIIGISNELSAEQAERTALQLTQCKGGN